MAPSFVSQIFSSSINDKSINTGNILTKSTSNIDFANTHSSPPASTAATQKKDALSPFKKLILRSSIAGPNSSSSGISTSTTASSSSLAYNNCTPAGRYTSHSNLPPLSASLPASSTSSTVSLLPAAIIDSSGTDRNRTKTIEVKTVAKIKKKLERGSGTNSSNTKAMSPTLSSFLMSSRAGNKELSKSSSSPTVERVGSDFGSLNQSQPPRSPGNTLRRTLSRLTLSTNNGTLSNKNENSDNRRSRSGTLGSSVRSSPIMNRRDSISSNARIPSFHLPRLQSFSINLGLGLSSEDSFQEVKESSEALLHGPSSAISLDDILLDSTDALFTAAQGEKRYKDLEAAITLIESSPKHSRLSRDDRHPNRLSGAGQPKSSVTSHPAAVSGITDATPSEPYLSQVEHCVKLDNDNASQEEDTLKSSESLSYAQWLGRSESHRSHCQQVLADMRHKALKPSRSLNDLLIRQDINIEHNDNDLAQMKTASSTRIIRYDTSFFAGTMYPALCTPPRSPRSRHATVEWYLDILQDEEDARNGIYHYNDRQEEVAINDSGIWPTERTGLDSFRHPASGQLRGTAIPINTTTATTTFNSDDFGDEHIMSANFKSEQTNITCGEAYDSLMNLLESFPSPSNSPTPSSLGSPTSSLWSFQTSARWPTPPLFDTPNSEDAQTPSSSYFRSTSDGITQDGSDGIHSSIGDNHKSRQVYNTGVPVIRE